MFAWVEIEAINRNTRAVQTIRVCNADIPENVQWNGQLWVPALHSAGSIGVKLFDGSFGDGGGASSGRITIAAARLLPAYATWTALRWQGAKIRLYAGVDAISPTLRFAGRVSRSEIKDAVISLTTGIDADIFDKDILNLSYAGTGGVEGTEDMKGNPKPWAFGYCRNVEPVLIDAIDNVYQFSAYGPIKSVLKLYERGSEFAASVGDYATYAALVAATIPAGRWGTCLASGLVRMGAPQYGVITGDIEGDYTGSVYRRKTGEILRHVASVIGVPSGNIDTASFDGIDTYAGTLPGGGNVNIVLTAQSKFQGLAKGMALPLNAHAVIDPVGTMSIVRPVIGTPTITLDGEGRQLPLVTNCVEGDTETPFKRVSMGGATSWRVHQTNEIAFLGDIIDRGPYVATESYREGHIVSMPDGNRYIFINTIPATSIAPPTSTHWSIYSPTAPSIQPSSLTTTVQADHLGAVVAGQLPRQLLFDRLRGEAVATDDATWSVVDIAPTGCVTVTNDGDGQFTITACAAAGSFKVRSVLDGVTLDAIITVQRPQYAPPQIGSGTGGTSAFDSTFNSINQTNTAMTQISDTMTVTTGTNGELSMATGTLAITASHSIPYDESLDQEFTASVQWEMRPAAGTWSTVGSVVAASPAPKVAAHPTKAIIVNTAGSVIDNPATITGLTASSAYEVRLMARRDTSSPDATLYFTGTISAAGG